MVKNKWKVAFVVVLIIVIILAGILAYQYKQNTKTFTFENGWEINHKSLISIIKSFEVGEQFRLCKFNDSISPCKLDGSGGLGMERIE